VTISESKSSTNKRIPQRSPWQSGSHYEYYQPFTPSAQLSFASATQCLVGCVSEPTSSYSFDTAYSHYRLPQNDGALVQVPVASQAMR
jgi:hypothetical protein